MEHVDYLSFGFKPMQRVVKALVCKYLSSLFPFDEIRIYLLLAFQMGKL